MVEYAFNYCTGIDGIALNIKERTCGFAGIQAETVNREREKVPGK